MTTSVTEKCPRDFINETLIGEIGAIVNGKEKHDYLSYLLISCGIEFLGKCTAPIKTNWQDHKKNGYYFKKGLALFRTLIMSLVSQTHYIVDYGAEYVTHYYLKIT